MHAFEYVISWRQFGPARLPIDDKPVLAQKEFSRSQAADVLCLRPAQPFCQLFVQPLAETSRQFKGSSIPDQSDYVSNGVVCRGAAAAFGKVTLNLRPQLRIRVLIDVV